MLGLHTRDHRPAQTNLDQPLVPEGRAASLEASRSEVRAGTGDRGSG